MVSKETLDELLEAHEFIDRAANASITPDEIADDLKKSRRALEDAIAEIEEEGTEN